jgi:hypothetical protein
MKAIVENGIIWGIGQTEEDALVDVRENNAKETAEAILGDHNVVTITDEQAQAVLDGNTAYNG